MIKENICINAYFEKINLLRENIYNYIENKSNSNQLHSINNVYPDLKKNIDNMIEKNSLILTNIIKNFIHKQILYDQNEFACKVEIESISQNYCFNGIVNKTELKL